MDNAILQLHVNRRWLKSCYQRLEEICIVDAVTYRSAALPSVNLFQNIAPLPPNTSDVCESETICPTEVTEDFVTLCLADDDDDSDWEYEDDDFNRNAFAFIIDDNDG